MVRPARSPDPRHSLRLFQVCRIQGSQLGFTTFNFDCVCRSDRNDHDIVNATAVDLGAFFKRGGKLLQFHGWSDGQISPLNSVSYYESVLKAMGGVRSVTHSYRLFMIPGMGHCAGGDGPTSFDSISAIEQWVEQDHAADYSPRSTGPAGRPT